MIPMMTEEDKKELLKRINFDFGEDNKSIYNITNEDLWWYLQTIYVWIDDQRKYYENLIKFN